MDPKYAEIYRKYRGDEQGLQILLYGPPGTGKTHVVKCLAGAMGCKIAVVQIKDVMANLVGDGAKIIAEIFEQAKRYDKCIIFFDEIDAIASSREGDDSRHTKEQLTTLLTNMDGFTSKAKPGQIRIVIAATNRPWALDSAVKRGGRFDTQIFVPMPDHEARAQLISNALRKGKKGEDEIPCAPDTTVEWLADRFDGYAGADIKAMCRQAASQPLKREILALQKGVESPDCITRKDVELVLSRYINSITDSDLMRYDAYSMNMELDDAYILHKADQLIGRLYRKEALEPYEVRLIKDLWEKGYLKDKFGDKYDLDLFMDERLKAFKK
jgi:transitional endoplasmic reticulum ATPase